jgi:hypothetical protein
MYVVKAGRFDSKTFGRFLLRATDRARASWCEMDCGGKLHMETKNKGWAAEKL